MTHDLNWLISVDDHILEPPHVWKDRVPAKYADRAPKIVRDDDGEAWFYEGVRIPTIGLTAVAGKKHEDFSPLPVTYEEMRPGCYDSVARLEDMNKAGILASLCFPSFPRFCGQIFYEMGDRDLGLACLLAYNDWILEEWCGNAPGRYIPMIVIPLWDPDLAVGEIQRCADLGAKAVSFSESPVHLGLPSLYDPARYWDPVFAAAQDARMPLCMHVGSSSRNPMPDSPMIAGVASFNTLLAFSTLTDWIFSGTLDRFPELKICLSEGGVGWIPPALERYEQVWAKQRHWTAKMNVRLDDEQRPVLEESQDGLLDLLSGRPPTEVFKGQVFGCFIEDFIGVHTMKMLGLVDNMMIETDYPHSDSSWPECIDLAQRQVKELTQEEQWKVLQGNARRVFRFEPADSSALDG